MRKAMRPPQSTPHGPTGATPQAMGTSLGEANQDAFSGDLMARAQRLAERSRKAPAQGVRRVGWCCGQSSVVVSGERHVVDVSEVEPARSGESVGVLCRRRFGGAWRCTRVAVVRECVSVRRVITNIESVAIVLCLEPCKMHILETCNSQACGATALVIEQEISEASSALRRDVTCCYIRYTAHVRSIGESDR